MIMLLTILIITSQNSHMGLSSPSQQKQVVALHNQNQLLHQFNHSIAHSIALDELILMIYLSIK